MKLYDYWRSTAAYRVRIALNLKGLDYEQVPVHLVRDGGEQHAEAYRRLNPQSLVPALETDDGVLTQSLAICEYLEERYPDPALLPADPMARARVRAMAHTVAMDVHPLNNLRVLQYLKGELGVDDAQKAAWYRNWVVLGFDAIEVQLASRDGDFASGSTPSLADLCLIPQVYNARRFEIDLNAYPNIVVVDAACTELDAFRRAAPEAQPDAA